jgi:ABC-2 type transport system ATP-binding protein
LTAAGFISQIDKSANLIGLFLMLHIQNLTHRYSNGVVALDNVSLDIGTGMFGLLGPNGAGKSTLMRVIATLQTPTSGSVRFGDIDVIKQPELLRRTLGYLPQDFGVYPRVTAESMLDHLAVLKGIVNPKERREAVHGLLNQVNLWSVRKKAIAGFSGGMRQRFGIAQALLGQPKLIIVDEPTAGLDPEERNRFLNLLAAIGDDVVVILSTHIVEDVAQLCRNMAILAGGKLVQQGAPEALRQSLQGKVWRAAVAREALNDAKQRHNVISERLFAGRTIIHVYAAAQPGPDFTAVEGGLEDVYFSTLAAARAA